MRQSNQISEYSNRMNSNLENSNISGIIHINNNWSDVKTAGICTGEGIESNPYIIKNMIIDGGGLASGILIENTEEHFIITNCYINNTGDDYHDAGIKLDNVENGQLINNTVQGKAFGIWLNRSDNNIILGNTLRNKRGLHVGYCFDNTIYLNNFIATQVNTFILLNVDKANKWSSPNKALYIYEGNTYKSYLGNYYALYQNSDNNNDGIGDTPYIKYGDPDLYVDYYPLIQSTENYEIIKFIKDSEADIPGYNLFLIIGILSIILIIINNKIRKS